MKKKTYPCIYAGQKQKSFSSSVVAGDLVWASGMGRLPETADFSYLDREYDDGRIRKFDPEQQTVDALDRIKHNLEEAGTSLENVVKWNWYVKDTSRNRDAIELAIRGYLGKNAPALAENMPAMSWIGVGELYFPNMLVEIGDIVAIMPGKEIETYPCIYAGEKQKSFSSTRVVGDLVWVSGMSGRLFETGQVRTPDPEQQTIDALDKIKHNLEEAGTSLENIVAWNLYAKDTSRDRNIILQTFKDYLKKNAPSLADNPPPLTWIGVREFYFPNMLVEMGDIVAVMPGKEIKTYPFFYAGKKIDWWGLAKAKGDLVWTAGMSGRRAETGEVGTPDVAQQVRDAWGKIKHNLEEVGTSLENIIRMNIYIKNIYRDRDVIESAWIEYLRKNAPDLVESPPSCTWVGVDSLHFTSMLVEFEPTAIIPG